MHEKPFDDLTEIYEGLIDWPMRLAREGLFYWRWFGMAGQPQASLVPSSPPAEPSQADQLVVTGVRSVIDVACGVGRHAAMLHSWGLQVEGVDVSPKMIALAQRRFGQPPGLVWRIRGFEEPIESTQPFDAAICVGNSLALASSREMAGQVMRNMLAAVRPGGLIVVHVLNLWRLAEGPCVWQKCQRTTASQGELVVVKGVHRLADRGFVDWLVIDPVDGRLAKSESIPLLALEAVELDVMARQAGALQVECFGGYADQPYSREHSEDLILVIHK